jgi:transglutaminase-like putative cysteine protease
MRLSIDARLDYWLAAPADLLFALEVAQAPDQTLVTDLLRIGGVEALRPIAADGGLGRRTWTRGEGRVTAHYTATVDVERTADRLAGLPADDVKLLPAEVVAYLFPSRYCESDRFDAVVRREFGGLTGGDKVEAMAAWIRGHLDYVPGSSNATTTAADTYVAHRGVCRDFAHLLIALTRAADIPARMVGAYAWRLDPPDFHAVVEVWLDGAWRLIDATGLAPVEGVARIGVGRDATDISFMTIFGEAECLSQTVKVERLD